MRTHTIALIFIVASAGSAAVASVVQQGEGVRFSDITAKSKISFRHESGASP